MFGLLLVAWSLLAPLGRAPDEPAHADLVFQQATGEPYPEFDGRRTSTAMIAVFLAHAPGFEGRWLTPESAPPRHARKTFEEWGGDEPSAVVNLLPVHPPLYYWLTGSGLRLERTVTPGTDASPMEGDWHLLRLTSVVMVLPLPLLAWAAARRLGANDGAAITAAVVPLGVPQLLHIGASINNDNLLILLSAVLAVLIAGVLQGDSRRSRATAIGLVAGLALLTKAFGFVLLPWVALAYAYQAWRERSRWRDSLLALLLAGLTASLVGGWWWARNLARYGELSPGVAALDATGTQPDPVSYARHFTPTVIHRFWGNFGYFEAPMTTVVVIAATAVAAAAVALALLRPAESGSGEATEQPTRRQSAAFVSLLVFLFAFVAFLAYDHHPQRGWIQGRYLFGAMVPFAVVISIGVTRLLGRRAPLVVFGGAALMQIDGVRVALRGWWAEPDASLLRSLDAMLAWSPWPRLMVYALVVAACISALAATFHLLRITRTSGQPTGGDRAWPDDGPAPPVRLSV